MDPSNKRDIEDELRAVETSFRHMAENVPGALFRYVLHPDGRNAVIYMSPRCLDLWEVEAERIQNDATILWQMVDAEDLPGMQASVMQSAQTLQPWRWEWRITTPSGKRKWLQGIGRPKPQPDASVVWDSLILDVTERKLADEALRLSELRLRQVMAVTGSGLWDWQIDTDQITHNRRWCELLGLGDEHLHHTLAEFTPLIVEQDRAAVMARIQACLDGTGPYASEHRMRRADGGVIWVEDRGDIVERDAAGKPLRMLGSITDITARRQAQEALRSKDAAIESSLTGVALADLDGRLTYVNPAFCRLWGVSAAEAMGRSVIDFWRTAEHPAAVVDALMTQGHWAGEMEAVRPDGVAFSVQIAATLVRDDAGNAVCMQGSFVDVSETRRYLAELLAMQSVLESRVAERTAELAMAKDAAEQANHSKSAFLARMSHELRTPLNAVLGFSQLLALNDAVAAAPAALAQLRHIREAGEHLLAMIDEVLDLARIESGNLHMSFETIELSGLTAECLKLVAPMATRHAVTLHEDAGPGEQWVKGDRTRLRQVVVNLLTNAIKYNRSGGRVDLCLDTVTDTGQVSIAIRDTGKGLTPHQIAGLFRPFNRLGAETSGVEGTGLGLVIARQLVEAMHGELSVDSVPGEGSVFTATLPQAHAADSHRAAEPEAVIASPASALVSPMLLLYVEDNPANVTLMQQALQLRPGVRLEIAIDGEAGLNAVRRLQPDLVLLDLDLPRLHGFEVLRQLRADPATARIPCVAVSANAMGQHLQRAAEEGFADYLTKPFDLGKLYSLIDSFRSP